jgi:hypothetical protein
MGGSLAAFLKIFGL